MRKKLTALLAGAMLMVAAASAWALPLANPGTGYSWINAPFWTNTDHTTSVNGNSTFTLLVEHFGTNQDSSFGLFYVNNINAPSSPTRFEVFAKSAAPNASDPTQKTITFWQDGSNFKITSAATPDITNPSQWTNFSSVF